MTHDERLRQCVIKALAWEPAIDDSAIGVSVTEGVVTLHGYVRSYLDKNIAGSTVRHLRDVRAVANDLSVNFGTEGPADDTDIARAVADALEWDSAVPLNAVQASVTDGWVTLTGTVEWQFQKSAAQVTVERTNRIKGVDNRIEVRPRLAPSALDVAREIDAAFRRSAKIDAQHVTVRTQDGTVFLSGTVSSLGERDEAERVAWSAPGVHAVDDRIEVRPRAAAYRD